MLSKPSTNGDTSPACKKYALVSTRAHLSIDNCATKVSHVEPETREKHTSLKETMTRSRLTQAAESQNLSPRQVAVPQGVDLESDVHCGPHACQLSRPRLPFPHPFSSFYMNTPHHSLPPPGLGGSDAHEQRAWAHPRTLANLSPTPACVDIQYKQTVSPHHICPSSTELEQ